MIKINATTVAALLGCRAGLLKTLDTKFLSGHDCVSVVDFNTGHIEDEIAGGDTEINNYECRTVFPRGIWEFMLRSALVKIEMQLSEMGIETDDGAIIPSPQAGDGLGGTDGNPGPASVLHEPDVAAMVTKSAA